MHPDGDARRADDVEEDARAPSPVDPGADLGQKTLFLEAADDRGHRLHRQPRRGSDLPLAGGAQAAEGVDDNVLVVLSQVDQTGARSH